MGTVHLHHYRWLFLTAAIVLLDQFSKYVILAQFEPYQPYQITAFFNITLAFNTGVAFSFLAQAQAQGWQQWILVIVSSGVSIGVLCWLYYLPAKEQWTAAALALILGGAIGNIIDRIIHGYVIDFLQLHIQDYYWPVFNVADSVITIGAVMLVLEFFWPVKKQD
ncbi:MAG: signal peptidase II [Gammaproteobacteria bacterium]